MLVWALLFHQVHNNPMNMRIKKNEAEIQFTSVMSTFCITESDQNIVFRFTNFLWTGAIANFFRCLGSNNFMD